MKIEDYSPKVCLLGATFSTSNMGVSALTAGIIKSIIVQFPNAEIVLLDYGKERMQYNLVIDKKNVSILLLNMRYSKKIFLKNNIVLLILLALISKLIPFQKLRSRMIARNQYLRKILESDIIASISGGDSFSDIYGLNRFLYVSLPQLLVLFVKKTLILLPQTLGPFERKFARIIAKYILNQANMVYSRDHTGLREMQSFLGTTSNVAKLIFCYDVGFVLDPIKPDKMELKNFFEQRQDDSTIIGFNISGLLFMGGYKRNNMFHLNVDYRELVYDIIDRLFARDKVIVLLIPHVMGTSEHVEHSENDSIVCEKIYNDLKEKYKDKLFLVPGIYNQNEIKYIIGQCDFFIGSRMHACIAALSQNIPAIAIAYSKKFFGVMQTVEMESLVADPQKMSKNNILDVIDQTYERRNIIKEKLRREIPKVQQEVFAEFKKIILSSQKINRRNEN